MEIFVIVCLGIFLKNPIIIFVVKYTISTAVIMENPVRSPIVPPISESILMKNGVLMIQTYMRIEMR